MKTIKENDHKVTMTEAIKLAKDCKMFVLGCSSKANTKAKMPLTVTIVFCADDGAADTAARIFALANSEMGYSGFATVGSLHLGTTVDHLLSDIESLVANDIDEMQESDKTLS